MKSLEELLQQSAALHQHLCPRQVLGVRMGMLAGKLLDLDLPQSDKRLLTIAETDGCAVDGIAIATNCWVGHRTLRIEDYGKIAATFIDTKSKRSIRIVPHSMVRQVAHRYAPAASTRWEAHLLGYQRMPDEELLVAQDVDLVVPVEKIVSRPGRRTICAGCQEEIINEREIVREGRILCVSCGEHSYYRQRINAMLEAS